MLNQVCEKCSAVLSTNEHAAYCGICEDCFSQKRTHEKHYKVGSEKQHSNPSEVRFWSESKTIF